MITVKNVGFKGTLRFFLIVSFCSSLYAQPSTVTVAMTQNKLKKIDLQINNLKQTLTFAHNQHATLHQELSKTEKQMGESLRELHSTLSIMAITEHKIKELQEKVAGLNQGLLQQQKLLASHVRARYQMGEYQPLKCMINPNDPHQMSRILTYYQYFIQSRQKLINQVDLTRQKIKDNQEVLKQELAKNLALKNKITQHQQQLMENKRYHTALIRTLNNEIQSKQQHLVEAQKNKNNLAALLRSLSQQSVTRTSIPFGQMHRKLPYPVQTTQRSMQRMNQGLTFFADEGTAVTAVYPGKVVFSDWLNGYGLLLILDHGQGFMTLYAHNQSLFKRKGQTVHQNEQIASIGHTGGIKQNGLYFEIRVRGKAVPPLGWLA